LAESASLIREVAACQPLHRHHGLVSQGLALKRFAADSPSP